jgi:hypothetical protein
MPVPPKRKDVENKLGMVVQVCLICISLMTGDIIKLNITGLRM